MKGLRYALVSTAEKTPGFVDFVHTLEILGFGIIATKGTVHALEDASIIAEDVAKYVGEPIFDGHVTTLSRELSAALLSQPTENDQKVLNEVGPIPRIDLVYIGLRPLIKEVIERGRESKHVIGDADVGGSTLLCLAATGRRIVMCRPEQIHAVLAAMKECNFANGGSMRQSFLSRLAKIAMQEVSFYWASCAAIHEQAEKDSSLAERRM